MNSAMNSVRMNDTSQENIDFNSVLSTKHILQTLLSIVKLNYNFAGLQCLCFDLFSQSPDEHIKY